MFNEQPVTVIIPALNEGDAIGLVVTRVAQQRDASGHRIVDKIIVCDNGSSDNTAKVAAAHGAHVVMERRRGYGWACRAALAEHWRREPSAAGFIVFVDGDNSVDATEIPELLAALAHGADLVIGRRVPDGQERGALTPQQRFGNWLATALIRGFWHAEVNDLGPFRAIRSGTLRRLGMRSRTFGWTCEMQLRAIQSGLQMVEVPVTTAKRIGRSKISGTLLGSVRAGFGILGTIAWFWVRTRRNPVSDYVSNRSNV